MAHIKEEPESPYVTSTARDSGSTASLSERECQSVLREWIDTGPLLNAIKQRCEELQKDTEVYMCSCIVLFLAKG